MRAAKEKEWLFGKICSLMSAGLPLRGILVGVSKTNPNVAPRVQAIINGLDAGCAFPDAVKRAYVLNRTEEVLLHAAHIRGDIVGALQYLVDYYTKANAFKRDVRKTLTRPTLTLALAASAFVAISTFIVPQMLAAMPIKSTPFFLVALNYAGYAMPYVGLLAFVGVVVLSLMYFFDPVSFGKIVFSVPILGTIKKFAVLSAFFGALSLVCAGGIKVTNAVQTAIEESDRYFRYRAREILANLKKGVGMKAAFAAAGEDLFPFYILEMVDTAERTDQYGKYFQEAQRLVEIDFQDSRNTLLPMLEAGSLVVVAAVVLATFLSIMLPVMELGSEVFRGGIHH